MGIQGQGLMTLVTAVTFILSHTFVLTTCQFTVQPVSVVQAQGLNAVFECQYPGATSYIWGLNGEFPTLDDFPPNVTFILPSGDIPAKLIIATGQYKNAVVQCVVVTTVGHILMSQLSVNATLQVQGPLHAVADLTVNNVAGNCSQLNVTWDAPFSLNLTTAEPNIQYCVDVYNVTYEGGKSLLQSECNITTTQYMFDILYPMGTYNFLVTPRSNIDGSLNGTNSTAQFSYEPQAIEKVNFTTNTKLSPLRVTFPESLIHECRVPDRYSVLIQYIDREVADPCICSTDRSTKVCGNTQMTVLDLNCSCNITRHRRCNLTVLAESNLQNTPSVITMIDISTHDVYKVTDLTMEKNEVSITVDYLPQSTDTGFVAIVYSVDSSSDSSSDLHYQVVYRESTSPTVGKLANHVYKLAVFDLNDVMKPERKLVYPAVLPTKTLDNTQYGTTEPSAGGEVAVPNPGGEDATEVNGTICISCSSSCVGIIHSQYGLDQHNITLIPRTVTDSGQNCTESMPQGRMYLAVIFKLTYGRLNEMPSYKTVIPIGLSTSTTASETQDHSVTAIVGGGITAGAATTVTVVFMVVIVFVWRMKRQEKRTLSTSHENEYDSAPPLNGPPPISTDQYENLELVSLTRATELPVFIGEPPPSYNAAATSEPFIQDMDESSTLSSPDHVPISADWTRHNVSTPERSNHGTAPNHSASSRVTQAIGASENEQVDSVCLHTKLGMDNPTQQSLPSHSKQSSDTKPLEETASSETAIGIRQNGTMADEPHDQSVKSTLKDPVYDVPKKDLANSTPTQNNNKTEIPVVYVDLDVKPKANSTLPMQHPIVYALLDESSLAPRSVENNTPNPCILPSLPPPPTAESVIAEVYPIAKRWEHLGEALGIKEHHLDSFSTEGHEQVCLHDMILYYFTSGPRSWEDIVKALWEIGETEAADKIIRSGKCTVEFRVTSPTETPPPLPPRNDTTKAPSHQIEAGELSHDNWQDHSVQEANTESTEEHQDSVQSADHQIIAIGESDEYNSEVNFPQSTGLGNKSEDGTTGRKLALTLSGSINEIFPQSTEDGTTGRKLALILSGSINEIPTVFNLATCMDKEEPTVPYRTTMIHFLGVFEKLDVPLNHKGSALGYLNSDQSAPLKDLYQQRMSAAEEVHENNISHVVPQNDNTTIENNGYTVKQSFGNSSSIPLLTRVTCIVLVTSSPKNTLNYGHLEVVSCSGELELARQVQGLPFEYLITRRVFECLLSQCVRWLTKTMFYQISSDSADGFDQSLKKIPISN